MDITEEQYNWAFKTVLEELLDCRNQLAAKGRQLAAKNRQLAEKDRQIKVTPSTLGVHRTIIVQRPLRASAPP